MNEPSTIFQYENRDFIRLVLIKFIKSDVMLCSKRKTSDFIKLWFKFIHKHSTIFGFECPTDNRYIDDDDDNIRVHTKNFKSD